MDLEDEVLDSAANMLMVRKQCTNMPPQRTEPELPTHSLVPTSLPSENPDVCRPGHSVRCRLCERTFTKTKSLHRHLDSVHSTAQYRCERCRQHFARKDILARHMTEGYETGCSRKTRRNVRKAAATPESNGSMLHCDRAMVTESVTNTNFENTLGYPGAYDDPFLTVLRMVDLVRPGNIIESASPSAIGRRKLEFSSPNHQLSYLNLKASVFQLLQDQVADEAHIAQSNSPWLASSLLALVESYFRTPSEIEREIKQLSYGGFAILVTRHRLTCCEGKQPCPRWLKVLSSAPGIRFASGLLRRHKLSMVSRVSQSLDSPSQLVLVTPEHFRPWRGFLYAVMQGPVDDAVPSVRTTREQ